MTYSQSLEYVIFHEYPLVTSGLHNSALLDA